MKQQLTSSLDSAKNPLLLLKENPSIDGIASAICLARLLRKKGKNPEIVSYGFRAPKYSFLPTEEVIGPVLRNKQPFVISLDVTKTKIDELTYDITDGKLNLYLTPKEGKWKQDDLNVKHSSYHHDLIITLECQDLKTLGETFKNNAEIFGATPILNIDHDASNENYGHVNAVDITATSCTEIIYPLLLEAGNIDASTATLLLSGIIYKTHSFKNEKVSPRALRYASELVTAGGKRDLIVHELYKTKDVPTLRLWGRVLARLKHDSSAKLAWSVLTKDDFIRAGAREENLSAVVHELIAFSKDVDVAVLIYENSKGKICSRIITNKTRNSLKLSEKWQGAGNADEAEICLSGTDIIEAEKTIIGELKKSLTSIPA